MSHNLMSTAEKANLLLFERNAVVKELDMLGYGPSSDEASRTSALADPARHKRILFLYAAYAKIVETLDSVQQKLTSARMSDRRGSPLELATVQSRWHASSVQGGKNAYVMSLVVFQRVVQTITVHDKQTLLTC